MTDTPTREQVLPLIHDVRNPGADVDLPTYINQLARIAIAYVEGRLVEKPVVDEAMIERGIKGARDTAFWADVEVEDGLQTEADWWGNIVRGVLRAALEVTNE